MGSSFSTRLSESNIELRNRIDAAATKVVLDSSFTDLMKLSNEKYCNRLVKKVAVVFQQNKDTVDLDLLRQKLYNQNQNQKEGDGDSENTFEKQKKKIKTPVMQNVEKKCIQISKFYVLFAHLFSCIVSTINPAFKIESKSKSDSSEEEGVKESVAVDFCVLCIKTLVGDGELVENSDGDIRIKPNVCQTNVSKSGRPLHLIDLPGMKALQELYKDANDGGDGEKEDARYLFKAFTGKDTPEHIRRLDQVPLKVYNKDEECKDQKKYYGGDSGGGDSGGGDKSEEAEINEKRRDKERRSYEKEREQERERAFYLYNERDRKKNEEENARTGVYLKGVVGSLKERLFSEYVQHIKEMIERAEYNRSKLLEVLSEMFVYLYHENGNIDNVIINPSLTYKKLQSLVVQTRRIVIKLYTDCEEDYKSGLDIFFAIVQEKIALKLSVQEDVLKQQLESVMYGPQERYIPESLLYQQFPGAEEFNKKQFVPPHFKSSVVSLVKKEVSDNDFRQILPTLNEWINEEIENATSLLNPAQVASEFLRENVYGDDDSSASMLGDSGVFSPPPPPLTAPAPPAPPAPLTATTAITALAPLAAPLAPRVAAATPKTKTSFPSGYSVSPSPRKVKTRTMGSNIKPTQLFPVKE